MEELEKAKRQALQQWEDISGIRTVKHKTKCGFCEHYYKGLYNVIEGVKNIYPSETNCRNCPVCKVEGMPCVYTDWFQRGKNSCFTSMFDKRVYTGNPELCEWFIFTQAVILYIMGFTKEDE